MAEQQNNGQHNGYHNGNGDGGGESGLDRLRAGLTDFLGAQAQSLTDRAGDALGGLTDKLQDAADNGGTLPRIGARVLDGESPAKAAVSEKAKDLKDNVVGKAKGIFGAGGGGGGDGDGGGGGGGGGAGDTKVTNIVEALDIGVPLRVVYNQWTQYEEFSSFTKGVRSVSASDEVTSDWKLKVGPSSRSWKATVQEQVPDEKIVWTSEGAKGSTRGSVTFHELAPSLTRIVVVVEYYPAGFFEKTGNIWRAQGRRLRLDLKHFVRYVTLNADEDVEGWRGEIRDGEVVRSHEEGVEDDEADAAEGEDAYDEEDESDDGAEAEDEDDEDAEDEDAEDDEGEDAEDDDEDDEDGDGERARRSRRDKRKRARRKRRDEAEDEYDDAEDDEAEDDDAESAPPKRRTRKR